jgi:excinuclease UvrABC nuclease subunit
MMDLQNINDIGVAHFTRANKKAKPPVHLPAGPGVYLLQDERGGILYVGMSSDIARRVRQHWYPHSAVSFYSCDESAARWLEKRLIGIHHPPFNTKGVGRAS